MSSNYLPDYWVVIKVPFEGALQYRVLVAWSGGYIHGNSWRLSSPVVKAIKDGKYYNFENKSGSCYICHRDRYGLHFGSVGTYEKLKNEHQAEMLDEDTEWESLCVS